MSEPLRIATAVEGPTDAIVLRASLNGVLKNKADFVLETLQPEESVAFRSATGTGWGGVYRWARQSAEEGGGSVSGSTALSFHDLLIVHVDADVAGKTYASASIDDPPLQDWSCPAFVDTLGVRREEEATMPKTHRPYAREFRQQMVELVQSGRTPEELALEYEPSAGAIRNWVAQQERDAGRREDGLSSDERQELRRLRRENKQLRIERDILKKAAAWFARESDSIPERGSSS